MKAVYLTKKSSADKSFEIQETEIPKVSEGHILIKVKAFGLNYADVMARKGLYPEMPPMPAILGYDVCGEVVEVGEGVTNVKKGDWVIALTRFGGYAEYAVADARVCIRVDKNISLHNQLAIATQLSTAYCIAEESCKMYEGDNVLVHAAAGGVGLGLVQLAIHKKCNVIAVASKDDKLNLLTSLGVKEMINYKKSNLWKELKDRGYYKNIDFIYDSVGGDYVKKGFRILSPGGKYVLFGAAKLSGPKNKLGVILEALKFGTTMYSPPQFLMPSRSMIGVNMLAIADNKPEVIERCMNGVYQKFQAGIFKELKGETFSINDMAIAHDLLERGQTMGKIAIEWK